MVCTFVPSPLELSEEKVEGLMCSSALKFDVLPQKTRELKTCKPFFPHLYQNTFV